MVSMAHAIRVHSTGGPDELQYERVPDLRPGHGEVLLRQTAIGVNFIDVYYRTGLYPLPSLPHVLGGESVGVVIGIGDGVDGIRVGDRLGCVSSSPPGWMPSNESSPPPRRFRSHPASTTRRLQPPC